MFKSRYLVQLFVLIALIVGMVACTPATPAPTPTAPPATVPPATAAPAEPTSTPEQAAAPDYTADIQAWAADVKAKYGGTTINVAFATHPSTDAFQKMVAEFTALTGIEVKWDVFEGADLMNRELLDFTGHTGLYDVIMVDGVAIPLFAPMGLVQPLDTLLADSTKTPAWFDYEDILPAFREGLGMNGGSVYGIPTAGESRFLAYRTDLFEKYNQKVPTTLEELATTAEFFNGKEPGLYGIALRAQKGSYFASGWLTFIYDFGDGFVDQTNWTARMDQPDVAESLEYMTRLLKTAPPDVLNYTHEEATSAFVNGKTAMWFDATSLVPWLEDPARSQIVGKIGYAAPPAGPVAAGGCLAGWDLSLSADAKNVDAGWAFIVYMTSRAMAKTYVADGGVASRTSIFEDPEYLAKDPSVAAQLQAFEDATALTKRGLHWIPPTPTIGKILDRMGYYGALPLAEGVSIPDALTQANDELKDILAGQ